MAYLIGTDEAGYGPNLGPLVVSASVWQIPDALAAETLYEVLAEVITARPVARSHARPTPVAIADSKRLYQPGQGLRHLERGVLAALACLQRCPSSWRQLCQALAPDCLADGDAIPWYAGHDAPVPRDDDRAACHEAADHWRSAFAAVGVRLVEFRSRVVFEEPFNRLIDHWGSKGEALSQLTLGLVAELSAPLPTGPIQVICDKHGGRNRYHRLLSDCFPEAFVEIYDEGRELSLYRFGPPQRRFEVRFCTRAESYLPTALASMASKYLRELAMAAFNGYWCQRVPGLLPTAGYPVDAARFRQAIAETQAALGIADQVLWRKR